LEGLGRVAEDTLIEKLLHYLGESDRGVVVEAKDGSVLGIATARGVVKALSAGIGPDQSSVKA
ncbi:glycine betaine/L-proline ABC transporter ATP-binding protein, partial [Planktomarina sp.]|nr:glycine betaine/L-proline ABC transporter ATP-binding protein [Planktomarina sp.]